MLLEYEVNLRARTASAQRAGRSPGRPPTRGWRFRGTTGAARLDSLAGMPDTARTMNEAQELNELLQAQPCGGNGLTRNFQTSDAPSPVFGGASASFSISQWTSPDGLNFFPSSSSRSNLPPGAYEIDQSPDRGLFFRSVEIKTEGILRLPEDNVQRIVGEIARFWTLRDQFRRHDLSYKRGIFMWGPPGSGKTCVIQLCCSDLINDHSGIVIRFNTHPELIVLGLRSLRQIEPNTPVIVVMEDMEELMDRFAQSSILQLLDGGEKVDNIVFLATSNYPERLGSRIVNRPSRFDKRFKIGFPIAESRRMYLHHLDRDGTLPIEKWVSDTDGFSMAHLKELFVATHILGDDYQEALQTLRGMSERIDTEPEFATRQIGLDMALRS